MVKSSGIECLEQEDAHNLCSILHALNSSSEAACRAHFT